MSGYYFFFEAGRGATLNLDTLDRVSSNPLHSIFAMGRERAVRLMTFLKFGCWQEWQHKDFKRFPNWLLHYSSVRRKTLAYCLMELIRTMTSMTTRYSSIYIRKDNRMSPHSYFARGSVFIFIFFILGNI